MNYWHCNRLLELRKADSGYTRRASSPHLHPDTLMLAQRPVQTKPYRGRALTSMFPIQSDRVQVRFRSASYGASPLPVDPLRCFDSMKTLNESAGWLRPNPDGLAYYAAGPINNSTNLI